MCSSLCCNVSRLLVFRFGLWCHFQQYFSYIMAVSFIGGGNRSILRKPLTCRRSLTNSLDLDLLYICSRFLNLLETFESRNNQTLGNECVAIINNYHYSILHLWAIPILFKKHKNQFLNYNWNMKKKYNSPVHILEAIS